MQRLLLYMAVALLVGCFGRDCPDNGIPECLHSRMQMLMVKGGLSAFARREKRFPDSLDELVKHGDTRWEHVRDEWGETLSYRKLREGYELFSNGPDRIPMTDDDVFADTPLLECVPCQEFRYFSWNCSGPFGQL